MNLNHFIETVRHQGQFESRGDFSLTLPRLLEKIASHGHEHAGLGPLALVAAGVGSGAHAINVQVKKRATFYRFEVEAPALGSFEELWQSLSGQRFLWAMGVQRGKVNQVSLHARGRQLSLTGDSYSFEPDSQPGGFDQLTTVKVEGGPPVQPLLLRHCTLCPVPLKLEGNLLQVPLDQAHRGKEVWWSSGVPGSVRPPGKANLKSELGVFLYPSKAPLWVAVVGGLSYPFTLETNGLSGILWSEDLKVDLGLRSLVLDKNWKRIRQHLLELCGARSKA